MNRRPTIITLLVVSFVLVFASCNEGGALPLWCAIPGVLLAVQAWRMAYVQMREDSREQDRKTVFVNHIDQLMTDFKSGEVA